MVQTRAQYLPEPGFFCSINHFRSSPAARINHYLCIFKLLSYRAVQVKNSQMVFVAKRFYNGFAPLWGLLLTTVLVGIILAWFFVNTKCSIFATMLGHTMFNWSNYVFPALKVDAAGLILFGLYLIAIAYIIWKYDRKTLKPRNKEVSQTPNR